MADKAEKDLNQASDCDWVRGLDAVGNPIKISKVDLSKIIEKQMGYVFKSYPTIDMNDCNTYIGYDYNGIYTVKESTLNRPPNSNYRAILFNLSRGGYYSQIYFEVTTGVRYFRYFTSAFSDWKQM